MNYRERFEKETGRECEYAVPIGNGDGLLVESPLYSEWLESLLDKQLNNIREEIAQEHDRLLAVYEVKSPVDIKLAGQLVALRWVLGLFKNGGKE